VRDARAEYILRWGALCGFRFGTIPTWQSVFEMIGGTLPPSSIGLADPYNNTRFILEVFE